MNGVTRRPADSVNGENTVPRVGPRGRREDPLSRTIRGVNGKGWITPDRIAEFARFCAVGLVVFGLDEGCLILLRSHLPLGLDTALAYALASLVNFVLSRQWVFEQAAQGAEPRTALVRYAVVIVLGLLVTAAAVPALSAAGLDYRIAKLLLSMLIGIANYFVFPSWVFRARPE
jgi:putative flippase GtrA